VVLFLLLFQFSDEDIKRLEIAARNRGKSIQEIIHELIDKLPDIEETFDVKSDPIYLIEGFDSDAPGDLSIKVDKYLYGKDS